MQIQEPEPEMNFGDSMRNNGNNFIDLRCSDGGQKYPNVSIVVKACLTLSHGNADAGRGFTRSSCIITENNTAISGKKLEAGCLRMMGCWHTIASLIWLQ